MLTNPSVIELSDLDGLTVFQINSEAASNYCGNSVASAGMGKSDLALGFCHRAGEATASIRPVIPIRSSYKLQTTFDRLR